MRKSAIYLFTLLLVVTGCSKDENEAVGRQVQGKMQFTSTLEQSTTRSISQTLQLTQLANGIDAGVFVTGEDGTILSSDNNIRLTADGRGGFTYEKDVFWPDEGDANIYAYAPFQNKWVDKLDTRNDFQVALDQRDEANYLASDLLYGVPANGNPVEQTDASVPLAFRHKLVKINLDLYNSTARSLENASVKLINVATKTTINLKTGEVAENGTVKDTVIVAQYSQDDVNVTGSAIIVPQTIEEGTGVVDIVFADGSTITAKMDTRLTLVSGKTYNFTINVGVGGAQLTVANSLTNWDSNTTGMTAYVQEPDYQVGCYLLKDGTVIDVDEIDDNNKANIIGVVFSNTVSAADAAAGYDGYALGLKRLSNRSWYAGGTYDLAVSGLEEAINDLDGRTKTLTFHNSALYKHITDSLASAEDTKNIHISNFDDYSLQPDEDATNMSDWFCPTFGQLVQILNNLGDANITQDCITSVNSKGEVAFSNWSAFYKYDNDTSRNKVGNSTFIDNINSYIEPTGQGNILAQGNISIATFTENKNRDGETYFELVISAGNSEPKSEAWEMTAAQGKWSASSNAAVGGKSVLAVIAFKNVY